MTAELYCLVYKEYRWLLSYRPRMQHEIGSNMAADVNLKVKFIGQNGVS